MMLALVTGGSGSGKSEFAESRSMALGGKRTYIAAMIPSGSEGKKRVERHRSMREGKDFETVERYTDIKNLNIRGNVLLECMSNLLANEMFLPGGGGENAVQKIIEGVNTLLDKCDNLIIVTNEISSDGIDYGVETVKYMKNLGTLNYLLAEKADEVYEVVFGIANRIK